MKKKYIIVVCRGEDSDNPGIRVEREGYNTAEALGILEFAKKIVIEDLFVRVSGNNVV